MKYQPKFDGWEEITLADMLVAYRKAKADCFFENTFPSAIKFADYEQDLLKNLRALLESLRNNDGFAKTEKLIGEFRVVPKKLSTRAKDSKNSGHIHFSSPERAFESLHKTKDIIPEFRIIGDFPVNAHIISALWINMIGHKFDAALEACCYGARLRRISNDENLDKSAFQPFHISAIGSFPPYFQPYQNWRNDGLKAIRGELEKDREIVAVSLDLKSYYHYIDPKVISSIDLQNTLNLTLSKSECQFTEQLAEFLANWARGAEKFSKKLTSGNFRISGGLAIGLTATRIISNSLLYRWDALIKEKLSPIHYGRYVDDMFLVFHDTGKINNTAAFMEFLRERIGGKIFKKGKSADKGIWEIQLGKSLQANSKIRLQSEKQKLFILNGQAGLDLLDSIEKEIYELSSEHRLMPSPDQLEDSTAARVLSASSSMSERADTLRRADGLTIRRLSWALQLRHVETLARDLPPSEWVKQRMEFYEFAHNHILRPDNIFEHFNYLPRLLGFAISLNEWAEAERIVVHAYASIDHLSETVTQGGEISLNGKEARSGAQLWRYLKGTLNWIFIDSAARYYDPNRLLSNRRTKRESRVAKIFMDGIIEQFTNTADILNFKFSFNDFYAKAPLISMADLGKTPYKHVINRLVASALLDKRKKLREQSILEHFDSAGLIDVDSLKEFLSSTEKSRFGVEKKKEQRGESYLPYIFPTRPYSPDEIAELAPECVGLPNHRGKTTEERPAVIWAKYSQAMRGIWVKPTLLALEQAEPIRSPEKGKHLPKFLRIGTKNKTKIIVALTNIKTDDSDWAAMASGKPNLSLDRYRRISDLVNQTIRLRPRPDYVLFPELSIPIRWVNSIASRLSAVGISMIAGTEYRHFNGTREVLSEACLTLTDNRLGFPATVKIWQPKLEPAVAEDENLLKIHGKVWRYSGNRGGRKKPTKPIYIHNGTHFGIMVCSELQNSKARVRLQGDVDALMVLSWNQDIDTFSSLIESTALDVHAYTILVNNRKYGDSRVRSPAKQSFLRELARVRGGDNDFVIAATLDIDSLRAFQSRAKRWPLEGDKFKPVPEGFRLSYLRRKLPAR
ncbi:RNA-directed DNA polymerase [Massilia rubra]|uniref:RNA-directed DNA polymerase n=1 Tax=Massilia rubra TaxID=2607910 RepID=A0ABX0M2U3_9BURK|nr:RNA-directed DNA polymerase [Massilia rubra]NHZ37924.1 RNA-directed DNA polymerase [Massilia rubra]